MPLSFPRSLAGSADADLDAAQTHHRLDSGRNPLEPFRMFDLPPGRDCRRRRGWPLSRFESAGASFPQRENNDWAPKTVPLILGQSLTIPPKARAQVGKTSAELSGCSPIRLMVAMLG